ncbi:unnamed protein product [Candidula unifasciata]|uniref:BHLH domain-containing protein n=1 Tax=Candidula unifasciata TaxID=100452 RepID=A0A8S3ZG81_9EUPU|nr:unnamed protein product [Candidula unifasciata]
MDLLLQAARVLELENSGHDVTEPATRGTYFSQNITESSEQLDGSQAYSDNGISAGEDDVPLHERTSRRAGGIGTREVHNQLEKNRRKQLREFFNHLQQCIPSLENKRVATQSILQGAIKHIKNLKKKDVEQEREIQMLAKRKSELKKKYDFEFNKCSEEQQRTAQVLLSFIRSKMDTVPAEQDGHSSDSTSTASEGPSNEDFSDGEMSVVPHSVRWAMTPGSSDNRKRKMTPQSEPAQGLKVNEPSVGSCRPVVCVNSLVSSSVSSSSVALKHMLEQRKKNQTATGQANTLQQLADQSSSRVSETPVSSSVGVNFAAIATKGPGSLTYSYPIITTHLASAVRPPMSLAGPGMTQSSQLTSQAPVLAVDRVLVSHALPGTTPVMSSQSESTLATMITPVLSSQSEATTMITPVTAGTSTKKNRKTNQQIQSKNDSSCLRQTTAAHNSSLSSHNISLAMARNLNSSSMHLLPDSPLKVTSGSAYLQGVSMVQPQHILIKTPENRRMDSSHVPAQKIAPSKSRLDLSNFGFLDKTVVGDHAVPLTLESTASAIQPSNANMMASKILPTVIPLSLASLMRGLPITAGLPQMVSLASNAFGFTPSTDSQPTTPHTELTHSSVLNSRFHITPNGHYLLTSMPVTSQQSSVSLSTNNARTATLLSAPPSHINKSHSPLASSTSTICPSSAITIPVTLTPTLVPLSLNNGQMSSNPSSVLSSGTPLHIFSSLSQTPMMATSLTNGRSSLIPTVVQLDTSGQVALLQNLIPGQHLQVQNSHHILTQPFVVMATANSNFTSSTSTATTTS